MREILGGLEGKIQRYYGTFVSFGMTIGRISETARPRALFRNIATSDGTEVADHLWADWDRLPHYSWLKEGVEVSFVAVAYHYQKHDEYGYAFESYSLRNLGLIKKLL